jgi:alkylation response protein AidB-like acyl-CoA dehydrogenase
MSERIRVLVVDDHPVVREGLAAIISTQSDLRLIGEAANADEAEAMRTLPQASVTALRESGLFALMLPTELGGAEADPMTQIEVIEAVSFIDPSTGWSYAIGASALSFCALLPDEAIARMFADGRTPTFAGAIMPGRAEPVAGGYRVTGRWSWGSGIRHAEWVGVHVLVEQQGGGPPTSLLAMLPAVDVESRYGMWPDSRDGSCDR